MRVSEKLKDAAVRGARRPGRLADGDGLYLSIRPSKDGDICRSWVLRVRVRCLSAEGRLTARTREMGLGPYPRIGLAAAREKARAARLVAQVGDDPILADKRAVQAKLLARREVEAQAARAMTFKQCAEAYVAANKSEWRNEKHAKQWSATLKTYAYPVFGEIAVSSVDVAMVTKVLDPIWTAKAETARRLRGRIEAVLDWAAVREHRTGDNPARWKGHLEKALPRRGAQSIRHHAALPYKEIAAFMTSLRAMPGIGARALEIAILTAARTGEIVRATWSELDVNERVWTIPAARMKAGKEHRVPLSPAAIAVFEALLPADGKRPSDAWVFSSDAGKNPLSNMALLMTLRRIKRADLTTHGFRSTFRDWAAERTSFPSEVAEAALAHAVADKVEAAYRRGDLFEKRRRLMQAWADACNADTQGAVVPFERKA